jgi:HlyD family secretion protein
MMKSYAPLVLGILLLVSGCGKRVADAGAEAAPTTPVKAVAAKRAPIHNFIKAEAIIYPMKQANIVPKISAPVVRFLVQRGDHVREGQLLAVLEDKDLAAAAKESQQLYEGARATYQNTEGAVMPDDAAKAEADVQSASEALVAAQKVYTSRQALLAQGALSQRLVDDAKVALAQAQNQFQTAQQHLNSLKKVGQTEQLKAANAQMEAAKAHYEGAQAQISYAEVRSPLNGIVSDRSVNVGEIASSGSALLSIVDLSRVTARASVSVQQAALLVAGRPATITSAAGDLPAKVTVVSPAVDPNTTTVQVWLEAMNTGEHLKLGSTVQISIDAGEVPGAIVVPAAALLSSDEGGEKVMVAGSDGLAHEHAVKVGIRSDDDVQILSGVNEGEQVITEGGLGLDDKAKVEIATPEAGGDKGGEKEQ